MTHTESVVEIPFSEDVSKAGGEAGALTLADNITVSVGGIDVTDRYTLDADGSTDGQVVLSSETPIDPRSGVTVGIDAVNDSIDTETIEPGSMDVTVASATVSEDDGDADAYEGSTLAFVATDGSADTNQTFEVEDGVGTLVFSGHTGAGSQVFTFDTAARNWSGDYGIETYLENGSIDRSLDVALRGLELAVDIDDRDVTTSDPIEGEISANATDRIVEVTLRSDADGSAVVERRDVTLDDTGDARFNFAAATVGEAGPGNYTVEVTDAGTGARNQSALIRVVAADVTDSSSQSDVVEEPDEEGEASFRSTVVKEHAGDVAPFGIELHQTDAATVTVGSDEDGFRASATVVDRDGDGTVRVWFNTAAVIGATTLPSDGGAVFGVVGKDESGDGAVDAVVDAGITANQDLTEAIEPGNYTLAVRPDMVSNATATDTGTLVVGSAAPRNLTNWVAPAGSAFSTRDDVSAAIEADRLTRTAEIAAGDVVVHRLVVPGLAGEFARQSGTPTEAFFALSGTDADARYGLNITRVGANDANFTGQTVPSSDGGDLYVPGEDNASVVADPANDTYVIAYESAGGIGLSAGDSRAVSFVVADSGPYSGLSTENRTLIEEYELLKATVSPSEDPLVVENETNQSIGGTTTVAPGTEIEFQIQSVNGTDPSFLTTKEAVVGPDGRWTLSVDFDTQRVGDQFSVTSAVDVVASVRELRVDGVIGTVIPKVSESTSVDRLAGGGQGGGGGGGGPAASGGDPTSTATGETTTPTESPDSTESVVDSTRRFLGGVLGTFVDSSGDETLRSRLLGFDVLVSLGALTTVALFVSRRE
ncbi:BGTF surface domain-containing protein [Halobellus rarus]|uniref:BGTF surface domain-containing protein n=1 Tax=Halobellus rarus TaxID=1126237 RepID=A0ABD6CIY5_9EURY|nr:BGTF surface domain-containing protein [Halobellus rarus]